jgi:alkanesulfonate monooxygenase SsuD/methylene tetrahydromethanopterin reductase-like flavin-dependent oxidoreductase (luciferase family)
LPATGSIHIEPLGIAGEVQQLVAAAGSIERLAADLPDRWIDELAIVGDLTHCADRIASLAGQGIDHVILGFPAATTPGQQTAISRELITATADRLP